LRILMNESPQRQLSYVGSPVCETSLGRTLSDEADMRQKRVLMITYAFPPVAFVGVHRIRKYCRYLGAHGWMPLVLTAKPCGVSFMDETLGQEIPQDVEVYRTVDFDPAKWLDKLSRSTLRRY